METMTFKNRREAGRQLSRVLVNRGYEGENILVLGIPRGGLVVADEVANALRKPWPSYVVTGPDGLWLHKGILSSDSPLF
jgi:predicted phosphoribosyltransferase